MAAIGTSLCSAPAPPSTVAVRPTPAWTRVGPKITPPPQVAYDFEMTYDAADHYVLLIGREAGSLSRPGPTDLWSYSGGNWTPLHPTTVPANCPGSSLTYDDSDGYVLYLGGVYSSPCATGGETWTYRAGVWTQLHPTTSPSPRFAAAMTNDSADSYVVLFGGLSKRCVGGICNDTWTFHAGNWTLRNATVHPSAREEAGMAYDATDRYVVLFGGVSSTRGPPGLNDTWKFSAGNWTQLFPSPSPPGPEPDGFTYDASDRAIVYTTAENWSSGRSEITWTFHGGKWSDVLSPAPIERLSGEQAYDAGDGYLVFFGGLGSTEMNDTWSFHAGVWTPLMGPLPRTGASLVYDAADHYVLLFGGTDFSTLQSFNDTWTFNGTTWTELHPRHSPPARQFPSMVFDNRDGYVVLFGGEVPACLGCVGGSLVADTWKFVGGVWSNLTSKKAPPARAAASATYDAADHAVLLFGGVGTAGFLNDTWAFASGAWHDVRPVAAPSQREGSAIIYDAVDGYVVLFGGASTTRAGGTINHDDTWTYTAGAWTNITVGGAPPGGSLGSFVFDAARGTGIMFGGGAGSYSTPTVTFSNETWSFVGGTWTRLAPTLAPPAGDGGAFAFDPVTHSAVLFGGVASSTSGSDFVVGDTWIFR